MSGPWVAPGRPEPRPEDPAPASAWGEGAGPPPGPASPALQRELVARVPLFPLRPMGLGEVLGAAMRIYRIRPRLVFGLSAVVFGLAFVLTTAVQGVGMIPTVTQLQVLADDPLAGQDSAALDSSPAEIYALVLSSVLTGLVSLVATQLVTLALARMVLDEAVGAPVSAERLRTLLRRRGAASVGLGLLAALAAALPVLLLPLLLGLPLLFVQEARWWTIAPFLLGILLGLLGALYVSFRCVLAVPALVAEQLGPLAALRRSVALTRGRAGMRVLGVGVLVYLVYLLVQQAVAGVLGTLGLVVYLVMMLASGFTAIVLGTIVMMVLSMLGAYLAVVLTAPFLSAGVTALYADTRMRREAWDVELAAAARAGAAPGSPG